MTGPGRGRLGRGGGPPGAGEPALAETRPADPAGDARSGLAASCAALYSDPAVRWLLGGELHPGGAATTRRALGMAGVGPGDRLLDLACGDGASAVLAAGELGCTVAAVDAGGDGIRSAARRAEEWRLADRFEATVGDAHELAFPAGSFDVVLCECALSTFADQARALAEIRRVLGSGGRLALADVVVDRPRLPPELDDGAPACAACIGGAHSRPEYEELLAIAGLRPIAYEERSEDAAAMARRVHDRLRGARVLGLDRLEGSPLAVSEAIELVEVAGRAIADGALGYSIIVAAG